MVIPGEAVFEEVAEDLLATATMMATAAIKATKDELSPFEAFDSFSAFSSSSASLDIRTSTLLPSGRPGSTSLPDLMLIVGAFSGG